MDTREPEEEGDVEVFERIPWDSLRPPPDRRWLVYLGAAAVVLTAVGVSVGREISPPVVHPVVVTTVSVVESSAEAPSRSVAPASEPLPTMGEAAGVEAWSEADLMAVPFANLEAAASALAEWFVVDWFTRDGSAEGAQGRSFVEWAGVSRVVWMTTDTVDVTVVMRRLASVDEGPYSRLPDEAWVVTAAVDGDEWRIIQGPVLAPPPEVPTDIAPLHDTVPPHIGDQVEEGIVAARPDRDGWLVELEWVDPAGLEWTIRQRIGTPEE